MLIVTPAWLRTDRFLPWAFASRTETPRLRISRLHYPFDGVTREIFDYFFMVDDRKEMKSSSKKDEEKRKLT